MTLTIQKYFTSKNFPDLIQYLFYIRVHVYMIGGGYMHVRVL